MLIKAGLGDGKIKWEIENGKLLILSFYVKMRNAIFSGSETTSKERKKLMTVKEVIHYN